MIVTALIFPFATVTLTEIFPKRLVPVPLYVPSFYPLACAAWGVAVGVAGMTTCAPGVWVAELPPVEGRTIPVVGVAVACCTIAALA